MLGSIVILETVASESADLQRALEAEVPADCFVRTVEATDKLLAEIAEPSIEHLALIPLRFRGGSGLQLIADVKQRNPRVAIVIVAEKGDVDVAALAIESGANDFLVRGPKMRERVRTLLGKLQALLTAVDRERQVTEYSSQLAQSLHMRRPIIGSSPAMNDLLDRIERVANVPRPLLILGERGTGKELVARAIHFASGPASRPLVTINCAAFNDSLLESELFGHERGSFTGAETTRRGKFERASGGTLFLDEIGHMSLAFQQKILRVVEYRVFQRVGGSVELQTSARIVAATNCDLRDKMKSGEFLPDLSDRLSFEVLQVPPLRARGSDIELLSQHFLDQFRRETKMLSAKNLSAAALAALQQYAFPGNVRELKTIIERAAYRDSYAEITPADLGLLPENSLSQFVGTFEEKVDAFSKQLLVEALAQSQGNQAEAARRLELSYHQLRYFLKKYEINADGRE